MSILRNLLTRRIQKVIDDASEIGRLNHAGTTGRWRELFLAELVVPLLPDGISATTGVLIDSKGTQSRQLDIIIYASDMLPPILRSVEQSLVPVDAAIQVIEVKSRLDAEEMKDCLKKASSVKSLFLLIAGEEYPEPINHILNRELKLPFRVETIFSVFAFRSDLKGKGKTEWERYREIRKRVPTGGKIDDICVVGSGYWSQSNPEGVGVGEDYNEVLSMLVPLLNSLPLWKKLRGNPQFSQYFIDSD